VLASTSHVESDGGWFVAGVSESPSCDEVSCSQNIPPPSINIVDNFMGAPSGAPDISEFAELDNMLLGMDEKELTRAPVVVAAPAVDDNSRSYDLSITWDKYYQTPRLWLFGYNQSGQPLKDEDIYQDVLSEYVTKTVTVDAHPSTGVRTASIHPCQHAKMMLKVINEWKNNNHPIRPDLSLFVFLKFISGVVPTINYDFTMDIDM
jgi:ubiquitin-like-conjugating enzyme ATG3